MTQPRQTVLSNILMIDGRDCPEDYSFTFDAKDDVDAVIGSIRLLVALYGEPLIVEDLN